MKRILIIEDDPIIQKELEVLLRGNGYDARSVKEFHHVEDEVKNHHPDLILLDINLPEADGFETCSRIRTFSTIPIIFVTSRNTDMDELKSILLGGDAYVTKPYHIAILLAKIASLLNKSERHKQVESMEHLGVKLHLDSSQIEHNGISKDLTKNEQKILYYLFKNTGKICSRADITEHLWDHQLYIDDNTLSVNITRIREKLSEIGVSDFITTRHRQGYMI